MVYYIDFEGYQLNNRYYVKEIALLGTECFNYYIKSPSNLPYFPYNSTTRFQFWRHNLNWNYGEHTFTEAIKDIQTKVNCETVYTKGYEKCKFLQRWLTQITEIDWIPSINKLKNCCHQICKLNHGFSCARRKVYEMQYADRQYQEANSINKTENIQN